MLVLLLLSLPLMRGKAQAAAAAAVAVTTVEEVSRLAAITIVLYIYFKKYIHTYTVHTVSIHLSIYL
jgi:hypothetical protein